jgi:hypothetical protein
MIRSEEMAEAYYFIDETFIDETAIDRSLIPQLS